MKYDGGKPRWDLVPFDALDAVVQAFTYGASKYDDDNWRKVDRRNRRYTAAAFRHLKARITGERLDPESGLPHLAHAGACILMLLEADVAGAQPAWLDER